MSRVKSNDTAPERIVRSYLHKNGLRFRLHVKNLPGTPDIVLPKYKTVIEVRGCFWHRHKGCYKTTIPKTNSNFWLAKFKSNVKRDRKNMKAIVALDWNVIIIWTCEVASGKFKRELTDLIKQHPSKLF